MTGSEGIQISILVLVKTSPLESCRRSHKPCSSQRQRCHTLGTESSEGMHPASLSQQRSVTGAPPRRTGGSVNAWLLDNLGGAPQTPNNASSTPARAGHGERRPLSELQCSPSVVPSAQSARREKHPPPQVYLIPLRFR